MRNPESESLKLESESESKSESKSEFESESESVSESELESESESDSDSFKSLTRGVRLETPSSRGGWGGGGGVPRGGVARVMPLNGTVVPLRPPRATLP